MDPDGTPVQPEGQGGEGADSPYGEYLSRFPDDESRSIAAEAFKEFDGNTTRKFQDAAAFRKEWEPFAETGINKYEPDAVQWMTQFFEAAQNNPQQVQEWYGEFAQQHGLQGLAEQEQAYDEFGQVVDNSQYESLIDQKLQPILQALQGVDEWRQQTSQQAQNDQIQGWLDQAHEQLKTAAGEDYEYDPKLIERFAEPYIDELDDVTPQALQEALQRGLKDDQARLSAAIKREFDRKLDAPAGAEAGRVADSNLPQYRRIDDPDLVEQAKAAVRAWNSNR